MISDPIAMPFGPLEAKALPASAAGDAAPTKDSAELRKIASDFETLFSKMFLSSMRKTVQQSPLFHGGRGEAIFSELLDDHYAAAVSKRDKGLGIADMIVRKYASHVKAQEEQKGRMLDTGRSVPSARGAETKAVAPTAGVDRHD